MTNTAETEYADLADLHRLDAKNWELRDGPTRRSEMHRKTAEALSTLLAKNTRLREALADIAKQKLYDEMVDYIEDERDDLDWVGGFEECVKRARAALG